MPPASETILPRRINRPKPATSKPEVDTVKTGAAYMLQVAARLQTTSFLGQVAESGVHPAGAYVLHELWRASPLSQSELSKRLDIGNATVGQTFKRLERDGLIKRKQSDADRRVIMVHLTKSGQALEAFFDQETRKLTEEIISVLGEKGATTLTKLLTRLANHFRESLSQAKPDAYGE